MTIEFASVEVRMESIGEQVVDALFALGERAPETGDLSLFGPIPAYELDPQRFIINPPHAANRKGSAHGIRASAVRHIGWRALALSEDSPIAMIEIPEDEQGKPQDDVTVAGYEAANDFHNALVEGYRAADMWGGVYRLNFLTAPRLYLRALWFEGKESLFILFGSMQPDYPQRIMHQETFKSLVRQLLSRAHDSERTYQKLVSRSLQDFGPANVPPKLRKR